MIDTVNRGDTVNQGSDISVYNSIAILMSVYKRSQFLDNSYAFVASAYNFLLSSLGYMGIATRVGKYPTHLASSTRCPHIAVVEYKLQISLSTLGSSARYGGDPRDSMSDLPMARKGSAEDEDPEYEREEGSMGEGGSGALRAGASPPLDGADRCTAIGSRYPGPSLCHAVFTVVGSVWNLWATFVVYRSPPVQSLSWSSTCCINIVTLAVELSAITARSTAVRRRYSTMSFPASGNGDVDGDSKCDMGRSTSVGSSSRSWGNACSGSDVMTNYSCFSTRNPVRRATKAETRTSLSDALREASSMTNKGKQKEGVATATSLPLASVHLPHIFTEKAHTAALAHHRVHYSMLTLSHSFATTRASTDAHNEDINAAAMPGVKYNYIIMYTTPESCLKVFANIEMIIGA
ncbi:hypothetical protein EDB84DRAFT_1439205 [Lactarius hengduanensis]|nr:hypothetical protein EDB84DRAFT_1439205 [Lactarius hengduanensis]